MEYVESGAVFHCSDALTPNSDILIACSCRSWSFNSHDVYVSSSRIPLTVASVASMSGSVQGPGLSNAWSSAESRQACGGMLAE
jgi:hypothetical protein